VAWKANLGLKIYCELKNLFKTLEIDFFQTLKIYLKT